MQEKKIVYNNKIIAVGGMIALGKTTLIEGLNKRYKNSIAVYELSEENKVQDLLLEGLYKKTVTIDLLQLYFLNNRLKNYIETVKNNKDKDYILFDRTTFEDPLFAKKLFQNSEQLKYYNEM
jgi:deoxyadenosine/deoxycytidine kinase